MPLGSRYGILRRLFPNRGMILQIVRRSYDQPVSLETAVS